MNYVLLSIAALAVFCIFAKARAFFKPALIFSNLAVCAVYVIWRITVLPRATAGSLVLGILLLAAELLGIVQFLLLQILYTKRYLLKRETLAAFPNGAPTVDVLICTYNEPLELLEKTILAALNLDYEDGKCRVWVCDDGNRETLRALCGELQAGYLARETHEGAKAGNINHALRNTEGELFAVLDADMICTQEFLSRTVGYFADAQTAFVQTPQVYYNPDMYQHNLGADIPNEQDFFMRDVQAARASVNAVLHVGTNVVFRRRCVEEIGLYPTDSITEDMAVGLQLQARGYRTVFVDEALAFGLSAATYTDLLKQRDRWCRGNLQVARGGYQQARNGLSRWQRLAYFGGTLYWFTSFQKMIYIFCPIWFMLTGQLAIQTDIRALILHFVPFLVGQVLVFQVLAQNTRKLRWAHYYEMATAPHTCMSVLRELFSTEGEFVVTPKVVAGESYFQARPVIPHMVILLLSALSWLIGLLLLRFGAVSADAFLINLIWSLYNFTGAALCIRVAYHTAPKEEPCAALEKSYPTVGVSDERVFPAFITSLCGNGIVLRFPEGGGREGADCSVRIGAQQVYGKLLRQGKDLWLLCYGKLSREEKRSIMALFMDTLRPHFDVGERQAYAEE